MKTDSIKLALRAIAEVNEKISRLITLKENGFEFDIFSNERIELYPGDNGEVDEHLGFYLAQMNRYNDYLASLIKEGNDKYHDLIS